MKTNTFKYFGLALMAILMVSFTSCEVEIDSFYDDDNNGAGYYNRSADLCSRTWVSFYRDMDGNYCRQELDFFLDRTGIDYIRVEYRNGYVTEDIYYFDWSWDNNTQTCIRMNYGPGDVSYFERIWMSDNTLSGLLDGTEVYFKGRY